MPTGNCPDPRSPSPYCGSGESLDDGLRYVRPDSNRQPVGPASTICASPCQLCLEPFQLVSHNLLPCAGRLRAANARSQHPAPSAPAIEHPATRSVGRRVDHLESLCVPVKLRCAVTRARTRSQTHGGRKPPALVVRRAAVRGRSVTNVRFTASSPAPKVTGAAPPHRFAHCIVAGAGHWRRSSPSALLHRRRRGSPSAAPPHRFALHRRRRQVNRDAPSRVTGSRVRL